MWEEKTSTGKPRYMEQYIDPMTGKTKKISVTVDKFSKKNRKWAEDYLQKLIAEKTKETDPLESLTLGELIEKYRAAEALVNKVGTCRRDTFAGRTLMRILGEDTLVSKISARYVREKFIATGKEPGTLNGYRKALRILMTWAYENDYLSDIQYISITKKFKPFKDTPHRAKIEDKYLEPEDLEKLLDGMEVKKWRNLTEFLVLSGMRVGEVIALNAADLDFKNHLIHVNKTFDPNCKVTNETPKTSCSIRDVYMQPQLEAKAREILTETKTEMMCGGYRTKLFISRAPGRNIDYFAYEKYLKENSERILGRRVTAHALRHTHASLLAAEGVDIETIARRLGHENSKITRDIYLHVMKKQEERDKEAIRGIRISGVRA